MVVLYGVLVPDVRGVVVFGVVVVVRGVVVRGDVTLSLPLVGAIVELNVPLRVLSWRSVMLPLPWLP